MTLRELSDAIKVSVLSNRPLMIWGAPGVGKSDVVRQAAAELGMQCDDRLRGSHLLPDDLKIPVVRGDAAEWVVCGALRSVQDSDQPTILFLDELSAAQPAVQALLYQLLQDHTLPNGERLRDGIAIVAAGNRESDGAVAYRMGTATRSRVWHVTVKPDWDSWKAWAIPAGVRSDVIGTVAWRRELLEPDDKQMKAGTFSCPRSLHILSDCVTQAENIGVSSEMLHEIAEGCIGAAAASQYMAARRIIGSLPDLTEVIKSPKTYPVPGPDQPAALYAIAIGLSRMVSLKTFKAIYTYSERMPAELAYLLMDEAILRGGKTEVTNTPEWKQWAVDHHELICGGAK